MTEEYTTCDAASIPCEKNGRPAPWHNIPEEIRDKDQWVLWRYQTRKGKRTKVPFQAHAPAREASSTDPQTWNPYEVTVRAYVALLGTKGQADGIGFVFAHDGGLAGFDLDGVISEGGEIDPWGQEHLGRLIPTYHEVSPSGMGIKGIVRGELPGPGINRRGLGPDGKFGFELYDTARFFTITGEALGDVRTIEDRSAAVLDLYRRYKPERHETNGDTPHGPPSASDDDLLDRARRAKNGPAFTALFDAGRYPGRASASEADFSLCCRLAFWFNRDAAAVDRMFRRSALMRDKWDDRRGDTTYGGYTIANAIGVTHEVYTPPQPCEAKSASGPSANGDLHHAGDGEAAIAGQIHVDSQINENDNDPHRLARVVVDGYTDAQGNRLLVHFQDQYRRYDRTCFLPDPFFAQGELVQRVKADLDRCNVRALSRWNGEGKPPTVVRVTRSLVADVNHALASIVSVDRPQEPPFWIDPGPDDPDPVSLLPARNGLIDLSVSPPAILPHTPQFFTNFVLPYAYDPHAPEPTRWLELLRAQWAEDQETIDSIHETLGYLLTPETKMHRMFLWIGPPRSGRSTMREVFTAVIGWRNVASTSAIALGGQFGLEPLLGKSVAIMGDARTGDAHDTAVLLDRLLRITGCDPVEVNRKGRPILSDVMLRARLIVISNELLNLRDASGAIVSRYHVIKATHTIPPEDRDPDLGKTIIATELPGILNLAIAGRRRLYDRGRFLQPASGLDLLEASEELASPVKRFVLECCDLEDKEARETTAEVYTRWKYWATEHGFPCSNDAVLGKNLRAAYPHIKTIRPRVNGSQVVHYQGIRLNVAF